MLDYVRYRRQVFFGYQELVDIFSYPFKKMSHLIFFAHSSIDKSAQLQDLFNVHSAGLTGELGPLGQGLFSSLLPRDSVTEALLQLFHKYLPARKYVLMVVVPHKSSVRERENNV